MASYYGPWRSAGMTRRQADLVIQSACALGWTEAIAKPTFRGRYKVVLVRPEGEGSTRLCAWTWADWLTICKEEAQRELPF